MHIYLLSGRRFAVDYNATGRPIGTRAFSCSRRSVVSPAPETSDTVYAQDLPRNNRNISKNGIMPVCIFFIDYSICHKNTNHTKMEIIVDYKNHVNIESVYMYMQK